MDNITCSQLAYIKRTNEFNHEGQASRRSNDSTKHNERNNDNYCWVTTFAAFFFIWTPFVVENDNWHHCVCVQLARKKLDNSLHVLESDICGFIIIHVFLGSHSFCKAFCVGRFSLLAVVRTTMKREKKGNDARLKRKPLDFICAASND